jgi:membrane-bound lytic murein transglycosylase B
MLLIIALWVLVTPTRQVYAESVVPDFAAWLEGVRKEALERGISPATLDRVLTGLQPIPRVIELDQRQPEFVDTFLDYLDRRVTPTRIEEGRRQLQQQHALLAEIQRRYGIPPHILVALWGLETNYGSHLGDYPVPAALATLAFDARRSQFFRAQLFDALAILEAGHVTPEAMKGSWAGAMGHLQFMPSTFIGYAVDADGDGRKDLWHSLPDAFASAANYLKRLGWRSDEIWGREVRLPEGFDWELARLNLTKPVNAWSALGVRQADGSPLPRSELTGAIIVPQGHKGPAFLVYPNFNLIMNWNRSLSYALAVGHLSDRLRGLPELRLGQAARHERVTRQQVVDLQRQLEALGFAPGEADGVIGARTRMAIKAFQRSVGLPQDGYPSPEVMARVRAVATSRGLAAADPGSLAGAVMNTSGASPVRP